MSKLITVNPALDLNASEADYVSEAIYWEQYYEVSDTHYEWNDGRLEEKPVSDYLTTQTYMWFMELLLRFLATQPLADIIVLEMGFRLVLPNKTTIRKPDLGVIRRDNQVPIRPLDRAYQGIFDLCIEALSDSNSANRRRDQVTKKAEYAAAGIPEYFILHHEPRYQAFYTLTANGVYVPIIPQDGVIHSRVLPGLQLRITDLTLRPNIDDLRADPVYQAFVAPGWQAAEARADAERERANAEQQKTIAEWRRANAAQQQALLERHRADAEATARRIAEHRAEAERHRTQRLTEQLRALGINPEAE